MALDTRWKNPQGSTPEQLHLWAQDLIRELRKGDYLPDAVTTLAATAITYSNATSGLAATNVQTAIDEVEGRVDDLEPPTVTPIASGTIAAATTNLDIPLGASDMVEIDLMSLEPSNDGATLQATFSQNNGSTYLTGATDYGYFIFGVSSAANAFIACTGAVGNAAGEYATITIRIYRPATAAFAKTTALYGGNTLTTGANTGGGGFGKLLLNTNAITHVRFAWSAGTYDAGRYAARGYTF